MLFPIFFSFKSFTVSYNSSKLCLNWVTIVSCFISISLWFCSLTPLRDSYSWSLWISCKNFSCLFEKSILKCTWSSLNLSLKAWISFLIEWISFFNNSWSLLSALINSSIYKIFSYASLNACLAVDRSFWSSVSLTFLSFSIRRIYWWISSIEVLLWTVFWRMKLSSSICLALFLILPSAVLILLSAASYSSLIGIVHSRTICLILVSKLNPNSSFKLTGLWL